MTCFQNNFIASNLLLNLAAKRNSKIVKYSVQKSDATIFFESRCEHDNICRNVFGKNAAPLKSFNDLISRMALIERIPPPRPLILLLD